MEQQTLTYVVSITMPDEHTAEWCEAFALSLKSKLRSSLTEAVDIVVDPIGEIDYYIVEFDD